MTHFFTPPIGNSFRRALGRIHGTLGLAHITMCRPMLKTWSTSKLERLSPAGWAISMGTIRYPMQSRCVSVSLRLLCLELRRPCWPAVPVHRGAEHNSSNLNLKGSGAGSEACRSGWHHGAKPSGTNSPPAGPWSQGFPTGIQGMT